MIYKLASNGNKDRTVLTPITFEELLSGRNFTAPGSPCHANQTTNITILNKTRKLSKP